MTMTPASSQQHVPDPSDDWMVCGWRIRSDRPYSMAPRWFGDQRDPHVHIRHAGFSPDRGSVIAGSPVVRVFSSCRTEVHVGTSLAFLIEDGRRITVSADPGVAEGDVATFLFGLVLAVLGMQRGQVALHAACATRSGGAVVICGEHGSGKSTTAMQLVQGGGVFLSDDLLFVDAATANALPCQMGAKLWQDSAQQLSISTSGIPRVRSGQNKYHVVMRSEMAPVALTRVLVLLRDPLQTQLAPRLLARIEAACLLNELLYAKHLLAPHGLTEAGLDLASALATRLPVVEVRKPVSATADALLDAAESVLNA